MGIKNRTASVALLLVMVLSGCDKFEMRGFVTGYESANDRFIESMQWNMDHPFRNIVVPSDEYTVFAMADSHVGGTKNLDYFIGQSLLEGAAATVMAGDITTGHKEDYEIFFKHLEERDFLQSFQIAGNHDLYFNGWREFYKRFGSTTYYFSIETPVGKDLYICLDTGSGTLGSLQLRWLKDVLRLERTKYRNCIVFTHNNLFRMRHTSSTNPFLEEIHVLMELCLEHQIDMVVTGHDHVKNELTFGNTVHITMDALEDISNNPGYFRINISAGKLDYEFVNFHQTGG